MLTIASCALVFSTSTWWTAMHEGSRSEAITVRCPRLCPSGRSGRTQDPSQITHKQPNPRHISAIFGQFQDHYGQMTYQSNRSFLLSAIKAAETATKNDCV
jgi:hypothetical protein